MDKNKKGIKPYTPEFKFKPLKLIEPGYSSISQAQTIFEAAWEMIDKLPASRFCKYQAEIKMREACMWMSRGISENFEKRKHEHFEKKPRQ